MKSNISITEWRIVAYPDGLQAKVNALRGLQSQSQEELDALLPSVLRPTGVGVHGRVVIMSLRGAFFATEQSPVIREDCFAIARNNIVVKVNALQR